MPLEPTVLNAVRVPSVHKSGLRVAAVVALIGVGLVLLGFGAEVWLRNDAAGVGTVQKTSTTTVSTPPKLTAQGGTTTTTVSSKDTTTPGKPATRSEAVAAALLGLGAVVFLCGVFFGRVQEVTLPGGGGFKLSPAAQATIAAKATEKAQSDPDLTLDPATVGKLYSEALRELASSAMGSPAQLSAADGYPTPAEVAGVSGTAPGDDVIDAAVDAAAKRLTET